jgi:4,5-DOPA dioxygenase extradiol
MATTVMPAAFFGHGSPRITFQHNDITRVWSDFASGITRPLSIVVISAHWFINASALTAMARPRTVHDFFYAPEELYRFEYPAPGNPELVETMIDLVRPTWLGPDVDSWGLDHGAWSLLAHLYPEADIPVVQLSVNAAMPPEYHFELGAQLAPLREQGVLILASGNIVHNGHVASEEGRASGEFERALAFDATVAEVMTSVPATATKLTAHQDYPLAAPTPDHFLPLLYFAGLAAAGEESATRLIDGPGLGSVGMSSYHLGLPAA